MAFSPALVVATAVYGYGGGPHELTNWPPEINSLLMIRKCWIVGGSSDERAGGRRGSGMLRILGSEKTLCDGLTRRDLLHIGGLGALGLTLDDALRLGEAQAAAISRASSFGKAKACILLFPYGSPPQHETFDPKPDAPEQFRGEMKPISTVVPGLHICEGLPRIAQVMDRVTVVRSMTHDFPVHGVAYAVSGIPSYTPALEAAPHDPRHWPFIGSVVDYMAERDDPRGPSSAVPRNVGLPWVLNSRADTVPLAGPYAAFLGKAYDPVWGDFDGKGTGLGPMLSDQQTRTFLDPYCGVEPGGHFGVSAEGQAPGELTPGRLRSRRSLLEQFDQARAGVDATEASRSFDKHQGRAFSMLTNPSFREALDIRREPMAVRESYGMTMFGQAALAARRLVEAGCRFVTVFWDAFGIFAGCAWDTHANHFPRLKDYLLPGFDRAFSGLILDLERRGLLDETLVMWLSEHGRTPLIDSKPKGAGRHHWSRAYSTAFAGGGVAGGRVIGRTDRLGGEVLDTPVSPKDTLATAFHLLGIDPDATVPDRLGRPMRIAGEGVVRPELF